MKHRLLSTVVTACSAISLSGQTNDPEQGIRFLQSILTSKSIDNRVFEGKSTPFELRLFIGGKIYAPAKEEKLIELRTASGISKFYRFNQPAKQLDLITDITKSNDGFFASQKGKQFYFICSLSSNFVIVD